MEKLVDLLFINLEWEDRFPLYKRADTGKIIEKDKIKIINQIPINVIFNGKPTITMKTRGRQKANALILYEKVSSHYPVYNALYCRIKGLRESRESKIVNRVKEIFHFYHNSKKDL